MTLVSPSNHSPLLQMEGMSRAQSVRSGTSDLSFNLRDIQEVYVAVGKNAKEWMENLNWVLTSIDKNLRIVFVHVNQPAQTIRTPIGPIPATSLEQRELSAYREIEKQEMNKNLKKYLYVCTKSSFQATTLTIDNDDIAKGLLQLIKKHNITDLVMGAGTSIFGNLNAKRGNNPRSKIARTVKEKGEPSCRIRFISKGKLICIREPSQKASDLSNLSRSSSGSSSDHSLQFRTQSLPQGKAEHSFGSIGLDPRSRSTHVPAGASLRSGSANDSMICMEFTYSEIKDATNNFHKLHKIGEGGYGTVYRGFLRHTMVAMKILNHDSSQGDQQFYQEIEILSWIRHPHFVTLIGACLEARVLVYEYAPFGSLDNHLGYKGCNKPLSWQSRVRVALEICSALIFLHLSLVVHGDLKPENILLDTSYMTKLSDFGMCRKINLTNSTSMPYHITEQPKGTLPYMDPEYLSSGELTPQYDVFSFGIVLLQLVTGKEARGLRNSVEIAMEQRQYKTILDPSAGWPLEQAIKMIQIGLSCSEASRRRRPRSLNSIESVLRLL